jgi:hypothetical protein
MFSIKVIFTIRYGQLKKHVVGTAIGGGKNKVIKNCGA